MSRIEEMTKRLCPEGVERVKIGNIYKRLKGTPITAGIMKEIENSKGNVTIFAGGKTIITAYEKDIPNSNVQHIPAVIVQSRGIIDVQYCDSPFTFKNEMWAYTHCNVSSVKYLYYFLRQNIEVLRRKGGEHGSMPQISLSATENYKIPLPPLSIQQEIVSVLDSFTTLIDKMKKEVELRKKQMECYCDKLYGGDFDGMMAMADKAGISVVTISELGTITRGKRFVRDDVRESGQPCIHYGDMYTYYGTKANKTKTFLDKDFQKKMRYAHKGDVVIVGAGENDYDIGVGLVWVGDEPAAVHDACYILEHKQDPMYISYYLRSNIYHQQLRQFVSSGKISSFSAEGLGKVYIPIQPLEKQHSIVRTLDAFDSYITKLEKLIALREKQYEYYREKLLTFE